MDLDFGECFLCCLLFRVSWLCGALFVVACGGGDFCLLCLLFVVRGGGVACLFAVF